PLAGASGWCSAPARQALPLAGASGWCAHRVTLLGTRPPPVPSAPAACGPGMLSVHPTVVGQLATSGPGTAIGPQGPASPADRGGQLPWPPLATGGHSGQGERPEPPYLFAPMQYR